MEVKVGDRVSLAKPQGGIDVPCGATGTIVTVTNPIVNIDWDPPYNSVHRGGRGFYIWRLALQDHFIAPLFSLEEITSYEEGRSQNSSGE